MIISEQSAKKGVYRLFPRRDFFPELSWHKPGEVEIVSPDTLQDEAKRDQYYYRVYVRTQKAELTNRAGRKFPIVPGMVANVEIKTGQKSVMDYLLKPLNKVKESMRER